MSQPDIAGLRAQWDEQGYITVSNVVDAQRTTKMQRLAVVAGCAGISTAVYVSASRPATRVMSADES